MNPEDAEALEFADTVEAIIESNISSSDSTFPRGLPPTISDRFVRLASATAQSDLGTSVVPFGAEDDTKTQTTLDCWFIENRDHAEETGEEVDDIVSESGLIFDSLPSPRQHHHHHRDHHYRHRHGLKTETGKVVSADLEETSTNQTETGNEKLPRKEVVVTQTTQFPPSMLRQASSPAAVTLTSKPPKPPSSEDPYRISIFSSSKTNRQLRRRLRRPRPRGGVMSSSIDHSDDSQSQNQPTQPLSWDEASDCLRLPPGLIPVFDPNPGWTNAPATTPFVLCNPPSKNRSYHIRSKPQEIKDETRIALFLSAFDGNTCVVKVPLVNKDTTLFRYVQDLCHQVYEKSTPLPEKTEDATADRTNETSDGTKSAHTEKLAPKVLVLKLGYRLWHPSDEICSHGSAISAYNLLSRDDLRLTPAMQHPIEYTDTGIKVTMLNEIPENPDDHMFCEVKSPSPDLSAQPTAPEQLLHLLTLLYQLSGLDDHSVSLGSVGDMDVSGSSHVATGETKSQVTSTPIRAAPRFSLTPQSIRKGSVLSHSGCSGGGVGPIQPDDFVSRRLTRKLLRQIRDPLALSSGALPDWCFGLSHRLAALFSFDSRLELLKAHAFGPARSVIWLQNQPPIKNSGTSNNPLSRSHSDGSSTSSGTHRTRQNAVTAAHTLVLSALTGQRDSSHLLSPSTASDVLLLRPSILSQLTTASSATRPTTTIVGDVTGVGGSHNSVLPLDQPAHMDNPLLGTLLTSLGLTLPPGFSLRSNCSRDLSELWSCLLSRTVRAHNGAQGETRTATNVGRLHKEFVRLPRMPRELVGMTEQAQAQRNVSDDSADSFMSTFWDWAACLMEEHASRKSELEIQFIGEDGTGLGPTLEFYSLLAAELRRRDGLMWVVDDSSNTSDDPSEDSRPALPTVASKATIGSSTHSRLYQADQSASSTEIKNAEAAEDENFDLTVEANAYVNTAHGLFPAAWPQDRIPEQVLYRFYILGITVAKCLQDNRRIDLPFSPPLLKLLSCYGNVSRLRQQSHLPRSDSNSERKSGDFTSVARAESVLTSLAPVSYYYPSILHSFGLSATDRNSESEMGEFMLSPRYRLLHDASSGSTGSSHWMSNLLGLEDFELIYPERARFFRQAVEFCRRKYAAGLQSSPPHTVNRDTLEALASEIFGCTVEQMCLSMEFLPTSKMFAGTGIRLSDVYDWEVSPVTDSSASPQFGLPDELDLNTASSDQNWAGVDDNEAEPVTVYNMEQYVLRTLGYCLDKGIRKQMDAFRTGFELVLPLDWLALFNGRELGQLIAGDSVAQWSREDLLAYTVPCFGFTHQSPTYQMLINVLCSFNALERRAFLQFTTGCSSLPPGGLKNLHPRLRVVRKDAGTGALPSVNTCVHYLKLPEYQTEEELRTVLLRATREIGFYLN
ncbi:unnamed protein product [Echinostoma caproni]|uniref:E3 ubiquitin-protein ligase n=1 Tax=Echinostoma caproni TaxID=27848 RepID=A0A3P8H719_9TREM|nr:unnamed protein product [Echinostoma caproni]